MRTHLNISGAILLAAGLNGHAMASAIVCGDTQSQISSEVTLKIEVNPYKHEQEPWDRVPGGSPAPDLYGKVQLADLECQIPVYEDTLMVEMVFKGKTLKTGDSLSIQLFDRDTMRVDDIVAMGNVEFTDNPTITMVGAAKITLTYIVNPPQEKKLPKPFWSN